MKFILTVLVIFQILLPKYLLLTSREKDRVLRQHLREGQGERPRSVERRRATAVPRGRFLRADLAPQSDADRGDDGSEGDGPEVRVVNILPVDDLGLIGVAGIHALRECECPRRRATLDETW